MGRNKMDSPIVICSCGKLVYEIDILFCKRCGDVMCYDCTTHCMHCDELYCVNCSENNVECIKCHLNTPQVKEKAYLVIDGMTTPIQNSEFMISKTSIPHAREIILKFNGKAYQYSFRSLCQREDNKKKFDYFIHFEEIIEDTMDWSPYLTDEEENAWNEINWSLPAKL